MSEVRTDGGALAQATGSFARMVAAGTPTPGGGSVAAYCGELAASLGIMVCNLTLGKPKYANSETRVAAIKEALERLSGLFRSLIDEDAASFESVLAAYRHPRDTETQKDDRKKLIQAALGAASQTPYQTAERSVETLNLLAELARVGNANALSDLGTGAQLARAAARAAYYNVLINLSGLDDRQAAESLRTKAACLVGEADKVTEQIDGIVVGQPS